MARPVDEYVLFIARRAAAITKLKKRLKGKVRMDQKTVERLAKKIKPTSWRGGRWEDI